MTRFPDLKKARPSIFSNYRWIPWTIVACFALVFAVNGGLVYFALESWTGLTTDHAYEDGLEYNRVIDESEKEAKLGWNHAIAFVSDGEGTQSGQLVVQSKDKSGQPLDNLTLKAEFERPVEELPSVAATLVGNGAGRYAASVTLPRAGQWQVYLVAGVYNAIYRTGRRIIVP